MENFDYFPLIASLIPFIVGTIISALNPFIEKESTLLNDIKLLKFSKIQIANDKLEEVVKKAISFGTIVRNDSGQRIDSLTQYSNTIIKTTKLCFKYDRISRIYRLIRNFLFFSIVCGIGLSIASLFKLWGELVLIIALILISLQLFAFAFLRYYTNLIRKQSYENS